MKIVTAKFNVNNNPATSGNAHRLESHGTVEYNDSGASMSPVVVISK